MGKRATSSGSGKGAACGRRNGGSNGEKKTPMSKRGGEMEKANPLYNNPEKRDFYVEETKKLGLDPAATPLFDWLDADDKATFAMAGAAR